MVIFVVVYNYKGYFSISFSLGVSDSSQKVILYFKISPSSWSECTNNIMKVKVAQSCPILCNPMDYIVHGIL